MHRSCSKNLPFLNSYQSVYCIKQTYFSQQTGHHSFWLFLLAVEIMIFFSCPQLILLAGEMRSILNQALIESTTNQSSSDQLQTESQPPLKRKQNTS
jgi:hypothetical protein